MKPEPFVHIKVPILNDEYFVVVCWGSIKVAKKFIIANTEPTVDLRRLPKSRGMCWSIFPFDYMPLIYINLPVTSKYFFSSLSHEAVHAINAIWKGIEEPSKEEVYAYSVAAIVYAVEKKVKSRKHNHD